MFEYVSEEQKRRYWNAFLNVYYGLLIDIDNTILDIENHPKVIDKISELLKRRVPVIFMTSLTIKDVEIFKEKLIKELELRDCDRTSLNRITILLNNGERIMYSKPSGDTLFTEMKSEYDSDKTTAFYRPLFVELKNIAIEHNATDVFLDEERIMKDNFLDNYTNVLTIKIKLSDLSKKDRQKLLEEIDLYIDYCNDQNSEKLPVNASINYIDGEEYLIINKRNKSDLISFAESIIGIKEQSLMIIGNNGKEGESNYQLLNRENAFTTDTTSEEIYNCHPVTNRGIVYKGDEAILFLLEYAHFVPSICLTSIKNDFYEKNYAEFVSKMIKQTKSYLRDYNDKFNEIFDVTEGIKDVFHETGAIKFSRVEWSLIPDNNPLKKFFSEKDENGNYKYILFDDDNVLLRGSNIYYYFLSHRNKDVDNDYQELTWIKNTIESFEELKDLLIDVEKYNKFLETPFKERCRFGYEDFMLASKFGYTELDVNYEINRKFILGILDNIRNIALLMLNYHLCKNGTRISKHISLQKHEIDRLSLYYDYIYLFMYYQCFDNEKKNNFYPVINLLEDTIKELERVYIEMINGSIPNEDLHHIFRSYRENDSFIENLIAMKMVADNTKGEKNYGVCGMSYGGLELPYLYKIVTGEYHPMSIIQYEKSYKNYKEFHVENISDPEPLLHKYFLDSDYDKETQEILLLDDNIMTGKSLQLAIDLLHRNSLEVIGVGVVKYPDVSRISHMFKESHGAVDYRLFMDYIKGLSFASKYTWRDENELNEYEDSLGYFDKVKKTIIESLIKNHDFTIESEVGKHLPKEVAKKLIRKKD